MFIFSVFAIHFWQILSFNELKECKVNTYVWYLKLAVYVRLVRIRSRDLTDRIGAGSTPHDWRRATVFRINVGCEAALITHYYFWVHSRGFPSLTTMQAFTRKIGKKLFKCK